MFTKILIANRGEIACRVAATARRLGIRTVAVYSDADAHAKHVQACDEAVHLGGPAPKDSYLRGDRIIAAAQATGAQAIHPGYGFLSENEEFAQACADAGLVFIGPPPSAIQAMGLKAESKRLMAEAGVPLVPGYHGADQDPQLLQREADRIGYPVLIKASAGGGGKGMRAVQASADFQDALASCKREAINSFGDDAVLVERYVTRPRHIEIQVFADAHGRCVYLFERDCSVQRRHQKVLEEAPAPGMTEARRREMGRAAVAAAQAVGYVGAGTVEFIAEPAADGDLRFYFMEMNTRLQVEHPVTEAITGLDLVEWQLRVAAGEPLPLAQEQLRIHGHAIEARLCAENPDAQFLPATGTLQVFRTPDTAAEFERGELRLDAGVREGDAISPYYDSMIAKLIVWGADRAQALARLDAALAQTHIVGLHTNVAFLRRVVGSRSFATADLDTALIERERVALFEAPPLPLACVAAGVVAHAIAAEAALQTDDPWSRRDGWRLHGGAQRRFDIELQGTHHTVMLERNHRSAMTLAVGGERHAFSAQSLSAQRHVVVIGGRRWVLAVYAVGERIAVFAPEGSALAGEVDLLAHAGDGAAEGGRLSAPMPGKVVAFLAKVGDQVRQGQPLAVLEAMKMEHTITAPRDGTVQELLYAAGDQVGEGGELLRLQ
ncbi:acetyl/propionyl/methylcrotonyl-CoA carboxylase subunit alpha [Rhizobacter sp. SG703]|uniref:acetyl/propionyl/methylcrotonyl-CoA carboxylase subunit alpha n=1 Tax=Rhizobacter sp. SG703 TaxID=2587140 RepID=UPI0014455E3D|nr:acetyl/propionyl/methylcrotonyl-CoA carboxylase subunit alpha [Rhizobacter sp. SG703]NKI94952.1 3-methylcrotonyl-CoA carboxylase alpha subunit [Rhizobacter sp. SG703]